MHCALLCTMICAFIFTMKWLQNKKTKCQNFNINSYTWPQLIYLPWLFVKDEIRVAWDKKKCAYCNISQTVGFLSVYAEVTSSSSQQMQTLMKEDEELTRIYCQTIQHLHCTHCDIYSQCRAWQGFGVLMRKPSSSLLFIHDSAIFHFVFFTTGDRPDISESLEIYMQLHLWILRTMASRDKKMLYRKMLQIFLRFILSHYQGSFHRSAVGCICVHRWRLVCLLSQWSFWATETVSLQRQKQHHTWGTHSHRQTEKQVLGEFFLLSHIMPVCYSIILLWSFPIRSACVICTQYLNTVMLCCTWGWEQLWRSGDDKIILLYQSVFI